MADFDQWVNLDPALSHKDAPGVGVPAVRCGPVLRLKARVGGRRRRGRRVFWGVQTDPGNVVPQSSTSGPAGWNWRRHQGGFGAPGFYEKQVPTNRQGESEVEFNLSEAGGDKFTIKAYTKTPRGRVDRELKSDTYTVWRQLFYQVTRMGPSVGNVNLPAIPNMNWAGVQGEFDDSRNPHNLRWTEVPAATAVITRHRTLYTDPMELATGQEGYDRTYEPLVTKVSLIDMMARRGREDHEFDVVAENTQYTYESGNVLFDRNSADSRDDWFDDANAWRTADPSQSVNVTRNDFTKQGPATIAVSLSVGTCTRFHRTSVDTSIFIFDTVYLGLSQYNGVWVINTAPTYGNPPASHAHVRTATDIEKVATMVHEMGHAIGMVPAGHPNYYFTNAAMHHHIGNHCWNGAAANPNTAGLSSPTGAICVMFGDNSSNTEQFCPACIPFVRTCRPSVDGKFKTGSMLP